VSERKLTKTVISIPIYTPAGASVNQRDREINLTTLGIIEVTDFSLRSRLKASLWENDKKALFRSGAKYNNFDYEIFFQK
jgi:hypothetical protein